MSLFVMCAHGLETLLIKELEELGYEGLSEGYCGVYVAKSSMKDVYKINYSSRLASRVLMPLLNFKCFDKNTLYNKGLSIKWENYIKKDHSFSIDANVRHYSLRNSLFAAQVLKDAICDRLRDRYGFRPNVDLKNPDIQINLFIDNEEAVISFDTSGQPLYKRGYRLYTGEAPLQETLAAALLKIANYNAGDITIDPCCGSGTLLIEAALVATNTPPGYMRTSWGFLLHPDFNKELWLQIKDEADSKKQSLNPGFLWGLEKESEVANFCKANIERAGFKNLINIECQDFNSHTPSAKYNLLISNPPHGKRLGNEGDLVPLYRSLGDFMKNKISKPGRGFLFTTSKFLGKEVGLKAKRRHVISSSGLDARLLEFEIF